MAVLSALVQILAAGASRCVEASAPCTLLRVLTPVRSIRIPATFCGIVGFRPTSFRTTDRGFHAGATGMQGSIKSSYGARAVLASAGLSCTLTRLAAFAGPMGRCADDMALVARAMFSEQARALDARIPPLLFRLVAGLAWGPRMLRYKWQGRNLQRATPPQGWSGHSLVRWLC